MRVALMAVVSVFAGLSVYLMILMWNTYSVEANQPPDNTSNYYNIVLDKETTQASTKQSVPQIKASSSPINAPLIEQKPELARGCEVTSLAMLLQTAGIDVSKLTLAQQIEKDPTPYTVKGGTVHFGNPNNGFVGDIYHASQPGYGVYHGPLMKLAQSYIGERALDLTGQGFNAVLQQLSEGIPVVVIVSTTYQEVPVSEWQTWQTESGPIRVSVREHAVLLTGYTPDKVYFNDPLKTTKNIAVDRSAFEATWKQFGSQAISYKSE